MQPAFKSLGLSLGPKAEKAMKHPAAAKRARLLAAARLGAVLVVSLLSLWLAGCAYFNLLYNAKNSYRKAHEIPKSKDGSLSRQQILLYDEVIKKCEMLVTNYPDSKWVDDAILLIGKAFYEKRNFDEAIVKFKELEEIFPESKLNEEGQIYLARSYLAGENPEQALPVLNSFTTRYEKSRYLEEVLFLLGTNSMKQGDRERAMAVLDRLAREYPGGRFKIEADLEMADLLMDEGEYQRSLQLYQGLLELKLHEEFLTRCLIKLAQAYVKLKRHQEAVATLNDLDRYVLKPATRAEKMLLEGKAYVGMDSLSQAIDTYRSVTARFPKSTFSAEGYYRLGIIYQEKLDSLSIAQSQFDNVQKQYPKSEYSEDAVKRSVNISNLLRYSRSLGTESEGQKAEAQFMLAELQLFQFNNPEKALVEYQKVLDQFGSSDLAPKAAYSMGYIYGVVLGDTARARETYRYLLEYFPDSQQAEYARHFLEAEGATGEDDDS